MDLQLKHYEIGNISNEDHILEKNNLSKSPDLKLRKSKKLVQRQSNTTTKTHTTSKIHLNSTFQHERGDPASDFLQ